ncbi:aldehyde dehydrogenase family-domain-containing protein [Aspergillus karnatakaensis]|uniref:aldehyde dehydrogenase family-domain-containing protein n=1 Tax=Aspergillus karnatakaensis TaxID=1810916 RepID=UPI003CCD725A
MHLCLLVFGAISSVWSAVVPRPDCIGISPSLLSSLTRFSEYSAASSCKANHNSSSIGLPVYCETGYCPFISSAYTEVLHVFSGIVPGDTTGYIAADHTNSLLIISFRDTMSDANRHTDFQIMQVDVSDTCSGCRAHIGFWMAASSAEQILVGSVEDSRARYPGYKIVVTGHSLGGAIATLYAVNLRSEGIDVDLYTFGAPSVGNFAFAEFITDDGVQLGANYRVTHLDDEIPKVLYRASREPVVDLFVPEYSQSSPEYWITSRVKANVTVADVQVIEGVNNLEGNLGRGQAMAEFPHISNWINGQYTPPTATKIPVLNPATESLLATIDSTSSETVNEIITTSWKTFHSGIWSRKDASDRFTVLSKAATLLRTRLNDFVPLETSQTGRPIREMRTQLSRVPEWLEYFASLVRVHEGRVTPFKGAVTNTLTRVPLGVVVQITPYNHPLLIAMKKIAAALAAGNIVIVKPSELAPLSVLKLGPLFKEAGLPDGVLQIVAGYGRETGKYLCGHPTISKIDLTGGLAAYKAIAPVAALNMVPITAELGGKAPVCLFPSVNVETVVKAALFAGFIASGQTCVTGSRLLVHQDIYEEFKGLLEKRVRALRMGDPTDEKTQIGSVISAAAVERCTDFVSRAVKEGGKILCGGNSSLNSAGKGFFFEPTVIETHAESDLACNEVFGPVIALIKCSSEDEIVNIANNTSYALGASVWTNDFAQAHRVADSVEAGIVWINGHHLNDPSSPWGGFKESGFGKENGVEAYESYTKVKSTVMNYGVAPNWFDDEASNARYG